ncbi:hypothetical protein D3C71_1314440 [compost metagenome]
MLLGHRTVRHERRAGHHRAGEARHAQLHLRGGRQRDAGRQVRQAILVRASPLARCRVQHRVQLGKLGGSALIPVTLQVARQVLRVALQLHRIRVEVGADRAHVGRAAILARFVVDHWGIRCGQGAGLDPIDVHYGQLPIGQQRERRHEQLAIQGARPVDGEEVGCHLVEVRSHLEGALRGLHVSRVECRCDETGTVITPVSAFPSAERNQAVVLQRCPYVFRAGRKGAGIHHRAAVLVDASHQQAGVVDIQQAGGGPDRGVGGYRAGAPYGHHAIGRAVRPYGGCRGGGGTAGDAAVDVEGHTVSIGVLREDADAIDRR